MATAYAPAPYDARHFATIGPHVTAYYAPALPRSNNAIVRGTNATLVFDANVLRFARELRAGVDLAGPPLQHLVLSHVHDDHSHGAMHFSPPARAWSRAFTRDRLVYWSAHGLDPFIEQYRNDGFEAGFEDEYRHVQLVVPQTIVEETATIDLGGGVTVRLIPEPTAHTRGDLWAFVEPDGIALCGDLWFNEFEPYIGNGSAGGSLRALDDMRAAGAMTYLPGHGPAAPLSSRDRDMMTRYVTWVLDRVREHVAHGVSGDRLKASVREEFEAQRGGANPIRFPTELPDFLEDAVEATEEEVRAG